MVIISYRHNFIFIKTSKVAGTSVEGFLRRFCGENDIITPVTPVDEKFLIEKGLFSKNYTCKGYEYEEDEYTQLVTQGELEQALKQLINKKNFQFFNHMNVNQIKKQLNRKFFDNAYKFTIDRHPYSYLASLIGFNSAQYNNSTSNSIDKQEIVMKLKKRIQNNDIPGKINMDRYTDQNNEIAVDKIIKFENLKSELAEVLEQIGINSNIVDLPNLKVVQSAKPEQIAKYLTDFEKGIIFQKFRKVFEELQYDPYVGSYSNEVLNGQLKLNENSEKLRLIQKELSNW